MMHFIAHRGGRLGAVKVEPPVADKNSLVEDGAVGAQDAVGLQALGAIVGTDVERLALCCGVGIVSTLNQPVAGESSVGHLGVDGVVLPGNPRDVYLETADIVVAGGARRVGAVLLLCEGKGDPDGRKGKGGRALPHAHPSTLTG